MAIVEIRNVSYQYPLGHGRALTGISLDIHEGTFYGVIGANGAGKSTLCSLIRGLIPNFYHGELSGTVSVLGGDLRTQDLDVLAAKVGYVFDNPFLQMSGVRETVFEEIAVGLENLGVPVDRIVNRVLAVSERLGIDELLTRRPSELSGGQRQRVAFASIVVMESELLVIDEPTSQLDPRSTAEIFKILKGIKEQGRTVVLVEHKLDLIAEYCDEVIVMENGRITMVGPTRDVLGAPSLANHGVEPLPVSRWSWLLAEHGHPMPLTPITTDEAVTIAREVRGNVH